MRFFLVLCFAQLWSFGSLSPALKGLLTQGAETALSSAAEVVKKIAENTHLFPFCIEPPKECPNKNITFWYYSRNNSAQPIEISVTNPESFHKLPRNKDPWKIIIHGYTKSKDEIPNPQLRREYFQHGDYNIISVDYHPVAIENCYLFAVKNVPLVANCTAQLIDALIQRDFFRPDEYHVIGFSLGAQISGLMYKYLDHGKPRRVTALDPAAPLFDGIINDDIKRESAVFVDVYHTNGLKNGMVDPSGHVDFYMNGGYSQPGCLISTNQSFSQCSHDRSPLYFAESINSPEGFWGLPCSSSVKFYSGLCNTEEHNLILMGEYVSTEARGSYYVQTTERPPFALGRRTSVIAV